MSCTQMPLISVIMPAYNAEKYIGKAIQSVQVQTYENWELIVVDDSSTDGTEAVVSRFAQTDSRIRLIKNERNSGVARTRNHGMRLCEGEYVAFLDSDDLWHPQKLEIQVKRLREMEADLVYTSYRIVDALGNKQCADFLVPESITVDGLLKENVIGCSTVLVKSCLVKERGFEEDFFHEDYVLWLQLLQCGCKLVGEPMILVDYFFHADSKAGNKWRAAQKRWQVYHSYLNLPLGKSLWYFAQYTLAGLRKYKKV